MLQRKNTFFWANTFHEGFLGVVIISRGHLLKCFIIICNQDFWNHFMGYVRYPPPHPIVFLNNYCFFQITKAFLEPLGANENELAENLVREEFISGISSQSHQRTKEEQEILSNLTQTMKEFYQTNTSRLFMQAYTQNCSDLIVYVGELITSKD
jgi:hypothetical protein